MAQPGSTLDLQLGGRLAAAKSGTGNSTPTTCPTKASTPSTAASDLAAKKPAAVWRRSTPSTTTPTVITTGPIPIFPGQALTAAGTTQPKQTPTQTHVPRTGTAGG